MGESVHHLDDEIYEAAIIPVRWPQVLAAISRLIGAQGGVLFSVQDHGAEWTASPELQGAMNDFVRAGWAANNTRMARGMRRGLHLQPRFVTEADYDPTGQIYKDAIYQDYFVPNGLGQSAGTIAPLPHGDMLCFSFERAFDLGPFKAPSIAILDDYRPHLMRASMLTARLGMERVRSSVETLAQLGFPAAAIDANGRVILGNELFDNSEIPWTGARDRLALRDPAAVSLLKTALEGLDGGRSVRSIPLRDEDQPARQIMHVLPIRREARDIFTRAAAIVVVTAVRSLAGDPAILQVMFDLTYAEAMLARRIAAGESLEAIGRSSGRSVSTLRNQLSSVLSKTGCTRQSELATVLNGLMLPID